MISASEAREKLNEYHKNKHGTFDELLKTERIDEKIREAADMGLPEISFSLSDYFQKEICEYFEQLGYNVHILLLYGHKMVVNLNWGK